MNRFRGLPPKRMHDVNHASAAHRRAADAAGLVRRTTLHALRGAFATHLFEDGVDIFTIQQLGPRPSGGHLPASRLKRQQPLTGPQPRVKDRSSIGIPPPQPFPSPSAQFDTALPRAALQRTSAESSGRRPGLRVRRP